MDNKNVRPRGTDSARIIEVIETTALCGRGTEDDLVRPCRQYWDFSGRLLAVSDYDCEECICRKGFSIARQGNCIQTGEIRFENLMQEGNTLI